METAELIEKIKTSSKVEDVLSVASFKDDFKDIMKKIHPDVCKLAGADEAAAKMVTWKEFIESGKEYRDDIGTYRTNGYWIKFDSDEPNLQWSLENWQLLSKLNDEPKHAHFQKYIPASMLGIEHKLVFDKRAIPLSGLSLPQEHVNWIVNRLLEYCSYLAEIGFVHCGLNPESVFIVPETHGIQIVSFYHWARIGNKVGTISGKYRSWYPTDLFDDKIATTSVDLEAVKKIGAYLLGAQSGNATQLRKTHNEDYVNFLVSHSDNAYQTLNLYKEMLAKNFKKQFHLLTI